MANISVNLLQIEETASMVDSYVYAKNKSLRNIDREIGSMAAFWQGPDYATFLNSWKNIRNNNSASLKSIRALENYASALRKSISIYRSAQNRAKNRAISLCKY